MTKEPIRSDDTPQDGVMVFIIGTFGHGRGGHYWDVKTITENLPAATKAVVINIGAGKSPVLENANVTVVNISGGVFSSFLALRRYLDNLKVSSIFVFDVRVAIFPCLFSRFRKTPIIFVKPGGPNTDKYYSSKNEIIVFSKENYDFFTVDCEYSTARVHLIPNRSVSVEQNFELSQELNQQIDASCFKLVQVLRITREYYQNFNQSIRLLKALSAGGNRSVALIIIGVVQCQETYKRILKEAEGARVYFFTDHRFTGCASSLLGLADVLIANGRSVMEGASLGLPILVSAKNNDYPVLLDESNFPRAFAVNFSPRFEVSAPCTIDAIIRLVSDEEYLSYAGAYSKKFFDRNFDFYAVRSKYVDLANSAEYKNISLIELFKLLKVYLVSVLREMRVFS